MTLSICVPETSRYLFQEQECRSEQEMELLQHAQIRSIFVHRKCPLKHCQVGVFSSDLTVTQTRNTVTDLEWKTLDYATTVAVDLKLVQNRSST